MKEKIIAAIEYHSTEMPSGQRVVHVSALSTELTKLFSEYTEEKEKAAFQAAREEIGIGGPFYARPKKYPYYNDYKNATK